MDKNRKIKNIIINFIKKIWNIIFNYTNNKKILFIILIISSVVLIFEIIIILFQISGWIEPSCVIDANNHEYSLSFCEDSVGSYID